MPAILAVYTIAKVAEMLGEDEEWLWDLSTDMFPEDGCLWVYDLTENGTPAFTDFGIENLQESIRDHRTGGTAPPPRTKSEPET